MRLLVALWGVLTFGYVLAGTWALHGRGASDAVTGLVVSAVIVGLIAVVVEFRP